MHIYCKLKNEREKVLEILVKDGYVWANGQTIHPKSRQYVPASGRMYLEPGLTPGGKKVVSFCHHKKKDVALISGNDFISQNILKSAEPKKSYPFKLVDAPAVELKKGAWFKRICPYQDIILPSAVEAYFRSGEKFNLIAVIKSRENMFIGTPNKSTNGMLFVPVDAPKVVKELTHADLQALVAEKYGSNVVLKIT